MQRKEVNGREGLLDRKMDFRYLEYFVEIARENNISRAAERLHVSQSAVNQYLLKLEKELNTQLFIRTPRNWQLTKAGEVYLEGCRKALLIRQDTYRQITEIIQSHKTKLTVGLTPNRGLVMFTSIFPKLHEKYPELTITPIELNAQEQMKAMAYGRIDLGFMVQRENKISQYTCIDLCAEEMVVQVPISHPICHSIKEPEEIAIAPCGEYPILPTIDLCHLREMPFVLTREGSSGGVLREISDSVFQEAGFTPNVLMDTTETPHIVQMAKICECCGIIPRYYADTNSSAFRYFALSSHPIWHLLIFYRSDGFLTQASKDYISLAKTFWTQHLIPPQKN